MFIYSKYQDYLIADRETRYKLLFPILNEDGTVVVEPEHHDEDHVFGSHCVSKTYAIIGHLSKESKQK